MVPARNSDFPGGVLWTALELSILPAYLPNVGPISLEVHRLSPAILLWHRYDPKVKADLFSTALTTDEGIFLVDPIPLDREALSALTAEAKVAGIMVTNANHLRAADLYSTEFTVPIYAAAGAGISSALALHDGERLSGGPTATHLEGAAEGEIALFFEGEGGTLVMGDALINFGSLGFSLLPAKYCSNQKLLRKSLRKLLDFSFERMLFAHGTPIIADARNRLAILLKTLA